MSDFPALLRRIAQRFSTQQAFATAIGISVARLNRAMNRADYPLNVENCLRLAEIADESPSSVLRLAGKHEVVDLIERLYGTPLMASDLNAPQRELLSVWDRVPVATQRPFLVLLQEAARAAETGPRRGGPSQPPPAASVKRRHLKR